MTTTQLQKNEAELLKQWQDRNKATSSTKFNHIYLVNQPLDSDGKANPDYGTLRAIRMVDDQEIIENIDLSKAEFLPVKVRVQIKCKELEGDKSKYWAREIESLNTELELMDQEGEIVARGLYKNLKEKYNLKYTDAAYVVYNGVMYRWVISGAHFDTWFEVKNTFTRAPHTVKITGMQDAKNGSVHFKQLNFALGKPVPVAEVLPLLDELDKLLASFGKKAEKEVEDVSWDAIGETEDVKKN